MANTTIWVTKELRDRLMIMRINEGKKNIEELIIEMLKHYKKGEK